MKTGRGYSYKGFESIPVGRLLEQVIDLSQQMGIAYERSCDFYKDFHTHDRLLLVFPRGACSMEIELKNPKAKLSIDKKNVAIVPAHIEHDDEGTSSIYDTLALLPSNELVNSVINEEGFNGQKITEQLSHSHKLIRSKWLDELLQIYFFERILKDKASSKKLALLEHLILVDIMEEMSGTTSSLGENSNFEDDPIFEKAIRFIESHLFEDLDHEQIAKRISTSSTSLLRLFRKAIDQTPFEYIRNRRLEEARVLLETKEYNVADVAMLVGYTNLSAFSKAYKQKFGVAPSTTGKV